MEHLYLIDNLNSRYIDETIEIRIINIISNNNAYSYKYGQKKPPFGLFMK